MVLMAVAVWGVYHWIPRQGQVDSEVARATTAMVESRDIRFVVDVAGEITPADQVSVRPEVHGRISELPVDISDGVAKGELLFALDDAEVQIEMQTRENEISGAQLELDQANRNYQRDGKLFAEKLVSEQVYENTRMRFELAQNAIERAQRALDLVRDRLSKTRIVAPFDCTVLTREVSLGQAVSGSGGFNSGTEVLTIANLSEMVINAHVNQKDVTRLAVNQEVNVQIEAVPDLVIHGSVERKAPQATIINNIKGFAVRILLRNVDPKVQPGMTAIVSIPVQSVDNVLAVPLAAVFTERNLDKNRTEHFVYVQNDDKFDRRLITVGISDLFFAEVQKGLTEGEVVSLEKPSEESISSETTDS